MIKVEEAVSVTARDSTLGIFQILAFSLLIHYIHYIYRCQIVNAGSADVSSMVTLRTPLADQLQDAFINMKSP